MYTRRHIKADMPPSVPLYAFYVCITHPKHALQDSNYVSGHHPRADKKKKKQKILSANGPIADFQSSPEFLIIHNIFIEICWL
jgi:hypothetical protein